MKHTQVMATIADTRADAGFIEALHREGMTGIRINSAHVNPQAIRHIIRTVHGVSDEIKVLMDTKGPEIRTTAVSGDEIFIGQGANIVLTGGDRYTDTECISVNVMRLGDYLKPGNRLYIDDGEIELEVKGRLDSDSLSCEVIKGGVLGSKKSVSVSEGASLPPLPAVSEKDRINIEAALELGIDMIAHSFVRSAEDVAELREILNGTPTKLYSKIECREALDNLEEIAVASDGLLVARGDLGAQIPIEKVPAAQMRVMALAEKFCKPVIVATQILHSMMHSPVPTRAEVGDIAFGTLLGADWLLLTGETAKGEYPVECVRVMTKTIEETEAYLKCKER